MQSMPLGESDDKLSLPKAVLYCFWRELMAVVFPRLCMIGFNFSQPFLIAAAINYVDSAIILERKGHGYGLMGATFLIYLGIAVRGFFRGHFLCY